MFPEFSHENLLEDIKRFVDRGDSLETTDPKSGWSLLHLAAELQDLAAIEYLIKSGCNPNWRDNYGQTPLHISVDSDIDGAIQTGEPIEYRATMMLIDLGADATIQNDKGETPLDWVDRYGEQSRERFDELVAYKRVVQTKQ
jgi:ankyrin repeat protein